MNIKHYYLGEVEGGDANCNVVILVIRLSLSCRMHKKCDDTDNICHVTENKTNMLYPPSLAIFKNMM